MQVQTSKPNIYRTFVHPITSVTHLGKGRHRQVIIYRGNEIGFLLYIEHGILPIFREKYILPDIEYGLQGDSTGCVDGKIGWIDFKVFDTYEEAFRYANDHYDEIAYLFKNGDYD